MADFIDRTRRSILALADTLDPEEISLVPTSRGLVALVDKRFFNHVTKYNWYAVISREEHMYAVADIKGQRISLQRLVLSLAHPEKSTADFKQVSFENKLSFDCRVSNLTDRVGRQSVMRNRKPKKNTSSQYKGVFKAKRTNGSHYWGCQIKGDLGRISLGAFDDEKLAAKVYDAAAFLLFNGAGYYNFPELCPDIDALDVASSRIQRFKNRKRMRKKTTNTE